MDVFFWNTVYKWIKRIFACGNTDKHVTVICWVVQKIGPPTNPATHLREKFLLLMWYNLFMGVNKMCTTNIMVTASVRVSATVRVTLAWFVSGNNLVALYITVWWMKCISLSQLQGHSQFTKLHPRNLGHSKNTKNGPRKFRGLSQFKKVRPGNSGA